MERYSLLLESEAKGCRKHPTEFRGFLALALLNNTCFAGRKKHKKQRLLHVFSQQCASIHPSVNTWELVEFSTSCTSPKEEDRTGMVL